MRSAVFISSGIGNALLTVPLIKQLSKAGKVTAISTSPFQAHRIFEGFEDDLFEDIITVKSTVDRLRHVTSFRKRFDSIYLDHFAADRKNIILAHCNAKKVVTPTVPHQLPKVFRTRLDLHPPDESAHESTRYLRFLDPNFQDESLNESLFSLKAKAVEPISDQPFITLQPGSGNNITPWKTLDLQKWLNVVEHILEKYPHLNMVVLGDESEVALKEKLPKSSRIIDAIGTYELEQLPAVVANARLHLGNDSAIMHLAGCLGVPSITAWGGSDPQFYGWHKINPEKHQILYNKLDCAPCSRWLKPNTSRIEVPSLCPDFACLKSISPEAITGRLDEYLAR